MTIRESNSQDIDPCIDDRTENMEQGPSKTLNSLRSGYLVEASVRVVAGTRVLVDVGDQNVWATLALAYCYQPAQQDKVLAISSSDNWYIVGVLHSTAQKSIRVQGDFSLHTDGRLNLSSKEGIHLHGPTIGLKTNSLILLANKVTEKYHCVNRVVKNELIQRIGKMRTTVKSVYRVKAERIVQKAEKDVSIDGKKINLG